jgi:hypothetical protein
MKPEFTNTRNVGSSKRSVWIGGLLMLGMANLGLASDAVQGEVKSFKSPNGLEERCVILNHIPGGAYSDEDKATESRYCQIDIYDTDTAICPKLRSTSPATFIYDLKHGPLAGKQAEFEQTVCPRGEVMVKEAKDAPTDFKVTMNAQNASATFAPASLLYYHFARYFDAYTHVPVSVFRTIDRDIHEQRISARGLAWSAKNPALKMNNAAWLELDKVEKDPKAYAEPKELFTSDMQQVFGILMRIEGKRYGEEINGTRKSGWGKGQNFDFQQTPAFTALRSEKPLAKAIEPVVAKGHAAGQVVLWMQELTEITLLDYIFSQQDRVGNIDYVEYWYSKQNGEISHIKAVDKQHQPTVDAILLKRTVLNDNDAGGKKKYSNFSKITGMLEATRHYNGKTYQRLQHLAKDVQRKGPLYGYLQNSFGLSDVQLQLATANIQQAAAILFNSCQAKKLRFDLDPDGFLLEGKTTEQAIACEAT